MTSSADAVIELFPHVQPEQSLQGLADFSHLWVVYWFHQNSNTRFHAKVHPPRLGGESIGVFATRSPHRPNPIGLSLVKIEKIQGAEIFVSGVDFVEGTPILDLKPYLPEIEKREAIGGWADRVPLRQVSVEFSAPADEQIANWSRQEGRAQIRDLIVQLVSQDPRPLVYRGESADYRATHVFQLHEADVEFCFHSDDRAEILQIKNPRFSKT